jgi:hypothetical protein
MIDYGGDDGARTRDLCREKQHSRMAHQQLVISRSVHWFNALNIDLVTS